MACHTVFCSLNLLFQSNSSYSLKEIRYCEKFQIFTNFAFMFDEMVMNDLLIYLQSTQLCAADVVNLFCEAG